MSYASVAANNAPPPDQQASVELTINNVLLTATKQPRPDPALLNTTNKVDTVVPTTVNEDDDDIDDSGPSKNKNTNRCLKEVEAEGLYIWEVTKHHLLRPGVAGGLIGLVNLGLLAGAGRAFYTQPHLRRDRAVLSSTAAAAFALLSVEGYAAERYRKTARGQAEEQHAREEGTLIYRHLREVILRPGVLGGIVGLLNTAVLGGVGYFSYINWDRPSWDRRVVSAVAIGLLGLWGGEGYVAQRNNYNNL